MTSFADAARRSGARSLAVFGDSITSGMSASTPDRAWPAILARRLGVSLRNLGVPGTTMQASPMADGKPKSGSGWARHRPDLIDTERTDLVAILYGFNDARYIGAPRTFNLDGFIRDYRDVVGNLRAAGYAAHALCLGTPPHIPDAGFAVGTAGFTGQRRDVFDQFGAAITAISREFETFLAPVSRRMAEEGGDALICDDHVHPDDAGHAVIADAFALAERA
jgi:lysophospholipase L1-like esterase